VNRSRRLTSYFLIFIFGFLSIKNLFSQFSYDDNCLEFGHIHMTELHDTHEGFHTHDHDDQGCHEGKSVFVYSLLPAFIFEWTAIVYKINFDVVFNLENNFASPFLEPDRKPPRA
jgi:ABC-type nickel/cobalt efflux system permease component RcnA